MIDTLAASIELIWRIAAQEAVLLKHEFVEPDHLFCALCTAYKDMEALAGQLRRRADSAKLNEELEPVLRAWEVCGLDPRTLSQKVRRRVYEGRYNRLEGEVIHRSQACKACFRHGEEIAKDQGSGSVYPSHLMQALLHEPTRPVREALVELGTTPENLLTLVRSVYRQLETPSPAGTSGRFSKLTDRLTETVADEKPDIPVERLREEEKDKLLTLEAQIGARVKGQDRAVNRVSDAVRSARAGLRDPRTPFGVYLFVGPTGVGKTELAKALAAVLFGSGDEMIRLDMSEYTEGHSVSRLTGPPPGYVGWEEGGQLTEALKTKPYSVVLLDEIDKAHPKVIDALLTVFAEGRLTDGKGQTVRATNAIFIMTANTGSHLLCRRPAGFLTPERTSEPTKADLSGALKEHFRPEFLNRLDVVWFGPLGIGVVERIAAMKLEALQRRLHHGKGVNMTTTSAALRLIVEKGYDPESGARELDRVIARCVEPLISRKILGGELGPGQRFVVDASGDEIILKTDYVTEVE